MPDWIKEMEEEVGEKDGCIYDEFIWILENTLQGKASLSPAGKQILIQRVRELHEARRCKDPIIKDGYGSAWSQRCPICEKLTMAVMRPGSVQCQNPDCPQWQDDYGELNGD
jgi:hypothetical protein